MMAMNAKALLSALLTSAAIGAAPPPAPPALEKVEVRQLQMGVMATLTVFAADPAAARAACGRAFARVLELNSVLSDYDPTSELRQLIAQAGRGPQPASPDLLLVLGHARTVAEQTAGQLDPTVGPLVQLWREARRARALPDPAQLAAARALAGFAHLHLDPAGRTITLDRPGMKLDLGAVAKGYAGDEALRVLREAGVSGRDV
jgi:thiamine biosynthesis lipoprotein